MDNDQKHTAKKGYPTISKGKDRPSQLTDFNPKQHAFHLLKTESWKNHDQAAANGRCSKGLTKHLEGGNSKFCHVHGFQTSGSH